MMMIAMTVKDMDMDMTEVMMMTTMAKAMVMIMAATRDTADMEDMMTDMEKVTEDTIGVMERDMQEDMEAMETNIMMMVTTKLTTDCHWVNSVTETFH